MSSGNIEVKISQMYDYAVSTDYLMKLFLQNIEEIKSLTETEFYVWLKSNLENDFTSNSYLDDRELEVKFIGN